MGFHLHSRMHSWIITRAHVQTHRPHASTCINRTRSCPRLLTHAYWQKYVSTHTATHKHTYTHSKRRAHTDTRCIHTSINALKQIERARTPTVKTTTAHTRPLALVRMCAQPQAHKQTQIHKETKVHAHTDMHWRAHAHAHTHEHTCVKQ